MHTPFTTMWNSSKLLTSLKCMEDPEHFEPPKTSEATSSLSIPDCSSGCPDLPAFCFFFCTTVKGRDFGRRFLIFTSAVPSALLFDNISQLEKIKIKIKNSREQIMEQIDARSQQKMARCVQSSFTLIHWWSLNFFMLFTKLKLNYNLDVPYIFVRLINRKGGIRFSFNQTNGYEQNAKL